MNWYLVVVALGLVLVIEGLIYAFIPQYMRRMIEMIQVMSNEQLRATGAATLAAGVVVIWLAQVFLQ